MKRTIRDISIKQKLIGVQFLTSTLVLLCCVVGVIVLYQGVLKDTVIDDLKANARMIGTYSAIALEFQDPVAAEEVLVALAEEEHVLGVSLLDRDGQPFVSLGSFDSVSSESILAGLETHAVLAVPVVLQSDDFLDVVYGMPGRGGDRIGTLLVRSDRSILNAVRDKGIMIAIGAILLGALVSIGVGGVLQRQISAPILGLVRTMKQVSVSGNFEARALVTCRDEIGDLVESFNHMLDQIEERDAALADERRLLEVRVAERTRDLREEMAERQEAEASNARLAAAIVQSGDCIVITNTDGVVEFVNPAFEFTTGYSSDEVCGRNMSILKSGQHDSGFYREFWRSLLDDASWKGKFINRKKDGTLYHADVTITAVRDTDGKVLNYVAVQRDVTQQIHMESQLQQALKLEAVGSLAAGIAHEINTPIQFIGDNLQFMSDAFKDLQRVYSPVDDLIKLLGSHPELASHVAGIAKAKDEVDVDFLRDEIPSAIAQSIDGVDRVASIVRAMKEFSHPGHEEKSAASINDALVSTLTVARNELKYVADVELDLDKDLPPVFCQLGELNQVFLNILVNAAHAIGDVTDGGANGKGTITVRTFHDDDYVTIAISDTGTGIPEEARDHIFEHFYTTKEVGRGTGQGLSIARTVVVEKHGGELTFETEMGKGTTFFIRLPLEKSDIPQDVPDSVPV